MEDGTSLDEHLVSLNNRGLTLLPISTFVPQGDIDHVLDAYGIEPSDIVGYEYKRPFWMVQADFDAMPDTDRHRLCGFRKSIIRRSAYENPSHG